MKTLKYIAAALVLFSASSCRTLEEYNVSPNQIPVGDAQPCDMMDEILCSGVLNCQQRFYDTFAELMQYTTITSSSNEVVHRYYLAPSYINNVWNNFARWAVNADHMYDLAVEAGDENYQAVALTLRSMYFEMLTSVFGYIPFFEANQLRNGINKPKFDAPIDIYGQIIEDLELANSLYDTGRNLSNTTKDKMYGGDTSKWQKFSNSLMLRILMRLSNRSNDMVIRWGESVAQRVKRVLDDPTTYPLMSSWEDNACIYFSGESPFQNTWGGYTESTMAGHRGSEFLIAQLNGYEDPRKWLWFIPYSQSVGWMGIMSGMAGDETQSAGYPVMQFSTFLNYKLPVSFMNYDEVCFLIAEAYCRDDDDNWAAISASVGTITDWYNKGVRASCEFWRYIFCDWLGLRGGENATSTTTYRDFTAITPRVGLSGVDLVPVIDDAAIDRFINESRPFDITNWEECLFTQKFIANFRVCLEGYNDYRRTGYPNLTIGTGTYNNQTLPYRLIYPTTTKTTNPDNYNEVLNVLASTYYDGADDMLTPVWWSEAALVKEIR